MLSTTRIWGYSPPVEFQQKLGGTPGSPACRVEEIEIGKRPPRILAGGISHGKEIPLPLCQPFINGAKQSCFAKCREEGQEGVESNVHGKAL